MLVSARRMKEKGVTVAEDIPELPCWKGLRGRFRRRLWPNKRGLWSTSCTIRGMAQLSEALIHPPGTKFHLNDFDAEETHGVEKSRGIAGLEKNVERLSVLQYLLYAEAKRSVLIVLQGIDAAGKDGVIRHVMAGMNPQGVTVTPFKVPEGKEKRHDYLWRVHKACRNGPDRHFQPVPLRGGSGCPGSQSGSKSRYGRSATNRSTTSSRCSVKTM